ncbi:hypothetical protein UA70_27355, partial [Raoultella planticola]
SALTRRGRSAAAGRWPDGGRHADYRPAEFVGLMAPHIARMMGFRRTMPQMVMAGLIGGLLLVFADWCGRMMMFPYQIPAGLLSTFIGAPYFIYLLRKQSR